MSWDVQGIHPASTSGEGTFAEPGAIALIKEHNLRVNAGRVAKLVPKSL